MGWGECQVSCPRQGSVERWMVRMFLHEAFGGVCTGEGPGIASGVEVQGRAEQQVNSAGANFSVSSSVPHFRASITKIFLPPRTLPCVSGPPLLRFPSPSLLCALTHQENSKRSLTQAHFCYLVLANSPSPGFSSCCVYASLLVRCRGHHRPPGDIRQIKGGAHKWLLIGF